VGTGLNSCKLVVDTAAVLVTEIARIRLEGSRGRASKVQQGTGPLLESVCVWLGATWSRWLTICVICFTYEEAKHLRQQLRLHGQEADVIIWSDALGTVMQLQGREWDIAVVAAAKSFKAKAVGASNNVAKPGFVNSAVTRACHGPAEMARGGVPWLPKTALPGLRVCRSVARGE